MGVQRLLTREASRALSRQRLDDEQPQDEPTAADAAGESYDADGGSSQSPPEEEDETADAAEDGLDAAAPPDVAQTMSGADGAGGHTGDDGGAEGSGTGTGEPSHPTVSRALTQPEIEYASQYFGDAVDYGSIQLTRWSLWAEDGTARTLGNTINLASDDFVEDTLDLTGEGLATVIHEMTHCMQYQDEGVSYAISSLWSQLDAWVETGRRSAAYDWRVMDDEGVPWEMWNSEQQAQLVEDYMRASRAQQGGKASPEDLETLRRAGKYVDDIRRGPRTADHAASDGGHDGAPSAP